MLRSKFGVAMNRVFLFTLAACTLLAFDGDSFSAKFEALPNSVRETATANMDNAFPVSISAAKGEQGWDYQVNTVVNGKYHNLVIDSAGKLVTIKDETDLAALPSPAKSALEKQASTAKILKLEKLTESGQITYGAVLKDEAQGTLVQVRVTPDGTVKPTN